MHFLFSQLDDFLDNLEAISDKHGDRFLLHLMGLEERYQSRSNCHIVARLLLEY